MSLAIVNLGLVYQSLQTRGGGAVASRIVLFFPVFPGTAWGGDKDAT